MKNEMLARETAIAEAKSYLGTPFHYQACVKGVGVACGPLVWAAYKAFCEPDGRFLPQIPLLPRDWHFHTQKEHMREFLSSYCIQVQTPQPGDTALFKLGAPDRPFSHCGLVIDWPVIIHAHHKVGVEILDVSKDRFLSKAVVEFWSPWGFKL